MKNFKTELNWAIIYTLASLIWMAIERLVGLHDVHIDKHMIYTNIFMLPAILIYLMAVLDKRKKDLEGKMTYRAAFTSGIRLTVFVAILSPVSQVITHSIISPMFFQNIVADVVSRGVMTLESAEQYFSIKNYMIQGVAGSAIMGVLTSAVVAIIARNVKTES
jgi:hypothetical protein